MHYTLADTIHKTFTTRAFATGIPTVLAGTPVVSAYEDDSVTQITAGITLGVDHDGVVGLNLLTLVLTGANGYEAGKDYNFVITTGTVGGVSVVGETVLSISLDRDPAFIRLGAPVGADISADIAAVKADTLPMATGTAQSGTASTIVLASAESFANSELNGTAIEIVAGTGVGQSRIITSYVGSTDTATVDPDWTTNPSSDSVYKIVSAAANVTHWRGAEVTTALETSADIVDEWETQSQADPTGFHVNILEVSGTAEDLATATAVADVPTVAEFNARTLIAASYFDPAADAVANVTLVATTTTNTDMRGTDSGLLAASAPTNFGDLAITVTTGLVSVGTNNDKTGYSISGTITTLDGLNNFAPATDAVANVTLVATTTTNTDQRGTNNAALASVLGTPVGVDIAADIAAVKADTVIPEKNVAFSNIYVLMVDNTDHVTPKTGLTLTAQRSIDGAAFGAVTGAAAEISNGIYQFDASAADMNGDTITFRFSGTAADDTFLTIVTR